MDTVQVGHLHRSENPSAACGIHRHQKPVLGVAVPHAVGNVVLDRVGPIIVACTFVG
jgi:hypothetical protein